MKTSFMKMVGLFVAYSIVCVTGAKAAVGAGAAGTPSLDPRNPYTPPPARRIRRDLRPRLGARMKGSSIRKAEDADRRVARDSIEPVPGELDSVPFRPAARRHAARPDTDRAGRLARLEKVEPSDAIEAWYNDVVGYAAGARSQPQSRGTGVSPVSYQRPEANATKGLGIGTNERVAGRAFDPRNTGSAGAIARTPPARASHHPTPFVTAPSSPPPGPPVGSAQRVQTRQQDGVGQARPIPAVPMVVAKTSATRINSHGVQASTEAPRGVKKTEAYFPGPDRRTSALLLARTIPAEVRLEQAYHYEIKLTNLTNTELRDLILEERVPGSFKVNTTTPQTEVPAGARLRWTVGALGPRASKTFQVAGVATDTGELRYCATVTFKTEACTTHTIVQPRLALTKTAPSEVMLCDPIPLKFIVTNTGTGVARNVRISDTLPGGWTTEDGHNAIMLHAGDLGAGLSREFAVTVRASQTGEFENRATAAEDGGLTTEATTQTRVVRPVLVVAKTGPQTRYLGRPATYEITVSNEGDGPAREVVLVDEVPEGMKLGKLSEGGRLSGHTVTWKLDTIEAGSSRTVTATSTPTKIATVTNTVTAKAYCAEASASWTMIVKGIPAILLEVVDLDDPIEAGAGTTYQITVLNQGSAEGTNIALTCMIPAEEEYVSATGPTPVTAQGQMVAFAPLPSLAPKGRITYRVVVRAKELTGARIADVRFRVSLTSDQAQVPVEETESTHIYQ